MFKRKRRNRRYKNTTKHQPNNIPQQNTHDLQLEPLEPRILLTTLYGGDIFEYFQANPSTPNSPGDTIRVELYGDIIVEVIGADLSPTNNLILGDLSGSLLQRTDTDARYNYAIATDLFGGAGGLDRIHLFGQTDITDPDGTYSLSVSSLYAADGNDLINIDALASRTVQYNGATYGFNNYIDDDNATYAINLLRIDEMTGAANVIATWGNLPTESAFPNESTGSSSLDPYYLPISEDSAVLAADFNPDDGLLYFIATVGEDVDLETDTTDPNNILWVAGSSDSESIFEHLYTVDVSAADIPASVQELGVIDRIPETTITSITFDANTVEDADFNDFVGARLYALTHNSSGGTETNDIVKIDYTNASGTRTGYDPGANYTAVGDPNAGIELLSMGVSTISYQPDPLVEAGHVLGTTGIEIIRDDPDILETHLFAVTIEEPALHHVLISSGVADRLGPLPDPDVLIDPIRGEELSGLAWHPTLINPFTGEFGTLLATDIQSDELVAVDTREFLGAGEGDDGAGTDAFAIYITQGDPEGYITFAQVPEWDPDSPDVARIETPWSGSIGSLRVISTTGVLDFLQAPADTGVVYIGGRTEDIAPGPYEQFIPILSGQLSTIVDVRDADDAIGVRPMYYDDLSGVADSVSAGLVAAQSLINYITPSATLQDKMVGYNLDNIQEITVSDDGSLIAIVDTDRFDANGNWIYGDELSIVNPITGLANSPVKIIGNTNQSGIQGLDYGRMADGSEELYAIYDFLDAIPSVEVGTALGDGSLGGLHDIVGLTSGIGNELFAINRVGAADYHFYTITQDAAGVVTAFTDMGQIPGVDNIYGLEAMPYTPDLFYFIAGSAGSQFLFSVDATGAVLPAPIALDDDPLPPDTVFPFDPHFTAVTDLFYGIAINPIDSVIYALRYDSVAGADLLVTIDPVTGNVTTVGETQIDTVPTDIYGMDFTLDGNLLALNDPAGIDNAQQIRINLTDPTASFGVTIAGSAVDGLRGYAGSAYALLGDSADDVIEYFYSVLPNYGGNDTLFVSEGYFTTIGTIDPTTGAYSVMPRLPGTFTPYAIIMDGTIFYDDPNHAIESVQAMAFSRSEGVISGQAGLYIIDNLNRFFEVNPLTGELIQETGPGTYGPIPDLTAGSYTPDLVHDIDEVPVPIHSMDFNTTVGDGRLFGQSLEYGRLVDIDIIGDGATTGKDTGHIIVGENTSTSIGSLRPTVGAIAYDSANGYFIAADNSTSYNFLGYTIEATSDESAIITRLIGLESDSAVGQHIGTFLEAGTLTGRVDVSGSIDLFYTGWLLTGNTNGELGRTGVVINGPTYPDNFNVEGDLRELVVLSSIGSNGSSPTYLTGFDLQVGGKIGEILVLDSFDGTVDAENAIDVPGLDFQTLVQHELEGRQFNANSGTNPPNDEGRHFQHGVLFAYDGRFYNDTFYTAQRLGTLRDAAGGDDVIVVNGAIEWNAGYTEPTDLVDYYSVALLAGQTITVQLACDIPSWVMGLYVGVFDPDGRLIATDYSDVNQAAVYNQPFQITADRPGEYRFAIATRGNIDFTYATASLLLYSNYTLSISGAGNMAIGGIVAATSIHGPSPQGFATARRGDIGGIFTGGIVQRNTGRADVDPDFLVADGSLRSIDAGQIGDGTAVFGTPDWSGGGNAATFPYITVNSGDIGLLRSNLGVLRLGMVYAHADIPTGTIGGDIQLLDATTEVFAGLLSADASIGVIRAAVFDGVFGQSYIYADADGWGLDGIIDLIDISDNIGSDNGGGPAITTGLGGNVRYIRSGGAVYMDAGISGLGNPGLGIPGRTEHFDQNRHGIAATITDDSGGDIIITPIGTPDPLNPNNLINPPALWITTYGIRSGGSVIVRIEVEGSLQIRGDSHGNGAPVEVSEIFVEADGRGVELDANGYPQLSPQLIPFIAGDDIADLSLSVTGDCPVDIFHVFAASDIPRNNNGNIIAPIVYHYINGVLIGGSFTSFINYTEGEVVNTDIGGVGHLEVFGTLGLAKQHTGAAVLANLNYMPASYNSAALPYPFMQQRNMVGIGNVVDILVHRGLGNIIINDPVELSAGNFVDTPRSVGRIIANYGRSDEPYKYQDPNIVDINGIYTFDGFNAPLFITGNVDYMEIGDGVLPSGSGAVAHAGIYVGYDTGAGATALRGNIRHIANQGHGSDIRGDIAFLTSLDVIALNNGSIINADIYQTIDFFDTSELFAGRMYYPGSDIGELPDTYSSPIYDLGRITLVGPGSGIIGSSIAAFDIGPIRVQNGFGIFNSEIYTQDNGIIDDIIVDGFGIRDVSITGAYDLRDVIATGRGQQIQAIDYGLSVQYSLTDDNSSFHPLFGNVNRLTDIHTFLSTTMSPTTSGVIEDLHIAVQRNIDLISAYRIESSLNTASTYGNTVISAANSIKGIQTIGLRDNKQDATINNATITTGKLGFFRPASDVAGLNLNISGTTNSILINGNVDGNSIITTSGPNGDLRQLRIIGDMDGDLSVSGCVQIINIAGNLSGNITIFGTNARRDALSSFTLGGSMGDGTFNIHGNVGTMTIAGSLGDGSNTEDQLLIEGNLRSLTVGRTIANSSLTMNVMVLGDLGRLDVYGTIIGDIIVHGNLGSFTVTNEVYFDFRALTESATGDRLLINYNFRKRQFELGQIDANGVVNLTGGIYYINPANNRATYLSDIHAIEIDPASTEDDSTTDTIYIVARLGRVTAQGIYSVDTVTAEATLIGMLTNSGDGTAITDSVIGLAINPFTDHITDPLNPVEKIVYAVLDTTAGNQLVTIDIDANPGTTTEIGYVTVSGTLANIVGMDFTSDGSTLYAIDDDPDLGTDARRIIINTGDPTISVPSGSASDLDGVIGYSISALDAAYTITPNDTLVLANVDGTTTDQYDLTPVSAINNTADGNQVISVGGTLRTFTIRGRGEVGNGDIGDGDSANGVLSITAGLGISTFSIYDGDIAADASVYVSYGDMNSLRVSKGDVNGDIFLANGGIRTVNIAGTRTTPSNISGSIGAQYISNFRVDGSLLLGATLNVANELGTLRVGNEIANGVIVSAGSARTINVKDLAGDLTITGGLRGPNIIITNDFTGTAQFPANARMSVRGDINTASLVVTGDLAQLNVTGDIIDSTIIVDGTAKRINANSITDSLITTGFDLSYILVRNNVDNTLIQAGISRGDDGLFGTADVNEVSRMGEISRFSAASIQQSVIVAGGEFGYFIVRNDVTETTVSSGFSVGGDAIASVLQAGTLIMIASPLNSVAERNDARGGSSTDSMPVLFNGNFKTAQVRGQMIDSALTAGVSPGDDGVFGVGVGADADSVVNSLTGGSSAFNSVRATLDANSYVIADNGTGRSIINGGNVVENVTYNIDDISDLPGTQPTLDPTHPDYITTIDTANRTWTDPVSGITIRIFGNVEVQVYDDGNPANGNGADIDTLVITQGDGRGTIRITGGGEIGRIISIDDAGIRELSYDGNIVGDSTIDHDLWIESALTKLSFEAMGAPGATDIWDGRVGGDVRILEIANQGPNNLRIGGEVSTLTIDGSFGDPLLSAFAGASANTTQISSDNAGNIWAFDGINLQNGAFSQPVNDTHYITPAGLNLLGMDFNAVNDLLGVANIPGINPSITIDTLGPDAATATLTGMAIHPATGMIYAINTLDSIDRLVTINPTTGEMLEVGQIYGYFHDTFNGVIQALAFNNTGTLFALVSDIDGDSGAYDDTDGVGLARIDLTTNSADVIELHGPGSSTIPLFIDTIAGDANYTAFTDAFVAMAYNSSGDLYVLLRDGGTVDRLYHVSSGTEDDSAAPNTNEVYTVTNLGVVRIAGVTTQINGMGFDADDNLIALDNLADQMVYIDTVAPASSVAVQVGLVDSAIDGFAVDSNNNSTFAYVNDGATHRLMTSADTVPTLGNIAVTLGPDLATFNRLLALTQGPSTQPIPLSTSVLSIAVDTDNADEVYVLTSDSRIIKYDANGQLDTEYGTVINSIGQELDITSIDFFDGELVAIDATFNRLVTINLASAVDTDGDTVFDQITADARMESGSINAADLVTITYDPSGTGRLIAYQDASGTANDTYVEFAGTDDSYLGGLVATSFRTVRITDDYEGRILATGNSFGTINATGNFGGAIITDSSIRYFSLRNGDFSGNLSAGTTINTVSISNGDFLNGGMVTAGGQLGTLSVRRGRLADGDFGGVVIADSLRSFNVSGQALTTSHLEIENNARILTFSNDLNGIVEAGSASLSVRGDLGATANVNITNDASTIRITGSTDPLSRIIVGGEVRSLNIRQTHSGIIAIGGGLGTASFNDVLNGGILDVALNTRSVSIRGDLFDSLLSFGTWIGADGIYNTADDVITGGSVSSVYISGSIRDSAVVAGILPNVQLGPGLPTSMRAYSGDTRLYDTDLTTLLNVDSAEAGGILTSTINRFMLRDDMLYGNDRSVVAAADGIGRISGREVENLITRVYGDPSGAPTVISTSINANHEIEIIFSEEMNTGYLTLSQDINNDGDILDDGEQGTITVTNQDGRYLDPDTDDLVLSYSTQTDEFGITLGVLHISRSANQNFETPSTIQVELAGNPTTETVAAGTLVVDRSGFRSALRDFNQDGTADNLNAIGLPFEHIDDVFVDSEDPFGTIIDGNDDAVEGGAYTMLFSIGDAADNFIDALSYVIPVNVDDDPLTLDIPNTAPVTIAQDFEDIDDIDVFHFTADAFEFFSVEYIGDAIAEMAVFIHDNQGTDDYDDDTFEMITRYEWNYNPQDITTNLQLFEAFELPDIEAALGSDEDMIDGVMDSRQQADIDFFIVTAPMLFVAGDANYTLDIVLAASDQYLVDQLDVVWDADNLEIIWDDSARTAEQIAYISNSLNQNNNELGFNDPKQLVYLNFGLDGETSYTTRYDEGTVAVDPFDAMLLDSTLVGQTDRLINGGIAVTGIVDNILTIYSDFPASLAGSVTVADVTNDFSVFTGATSGIYFTTADPTSLGVDFTTVFIGDADDSLFGGSLLGIASQIDLANLDKADEALVFAQNMAGFSSQAGVVGRLNEYSTLLANIISHELGHILGFNHHPTNYSDYLLDADDTDNDPNTPDDSNRGVSLMAYSPNDILISRLSQYGTKPVTANEFPIGDIDQIDCLIKWFS